MSPRPAAVSAYIVRSSPATGVRLIFSATLAMSVATIITGVPRKTTRVFLTGCTRSIPGTPPSSACIDRGNRSVRITMSGDGMTNRSGFRAASIHSMIEE
jgi:hypothetical protein